MVPNQYNPQYLNRYSYSINNPLKYTDPSGHNPICVAMDASVIGIPASVPCWLITAIVIAVIGDLTLGGDTVAPPPVIESKPVDYPIPLPLPMSRGYPQTKDSRRMERDLPRPKHGLPERDPKQNIPVEPIPRGWEPPGPTDFKFAQRLGPTLGIPLILALLWSYIMKGDDTPFVPLGPPTPSQSRQNLAYPVGPNITPSNFEPFQVPMYNYQPSYYVPLQLSPTLPPPPQDRCLNVPIGHFGCE